MPDKAKKPATEELLFPDLPICDTHHHYFTGPEMRYSPEDFLQDILTGHNIVSTVHVSAKTGWREDGPENMKPVGETEYLEKLPRTSKKAPQIKLAAGIIGLADLNSGDAVKPILEAHLAASPKRFRGIRVIVAWDSSPACTRFINASRKGLLMDPTFRRGLSHLKEYNLSFEATLFHTQLVELVDLAKKFPDTVIIAGHTGEPLGAGPYADKQDEVVRIWKQGIADLAKCENVYLKIGGFGMEIAAYHLNTLPKPINSAALAERIRPWVLWCIEKFGAKRCMFESNFPIDKPCISYFDLWNTFKKLTSDFSSNERKALFHDTAVKVYRLAE
jgi:L-fuconolactonase